ncbi:hypothetical protein KJ781_01090 [Patescibacteria group bacterium]|nr:hypothetical protein [Patescibacteria group bacterium]MBU1448746.1 hypothetical protein [Patescibacteria group bacterium]MBU2613583.1 hypothetical protein [Patescibacteria group bacterium]
MRFLAQILFSVSVGIYLVFWIWAVVHATQTPRASRMQRILWGVAMVANPTTAIWYWYIWKRWTFWTLFTPVLVAFFSFPLVVRSLLTKADETRITDILFSLGSARLVLLVATLMVFPLVLRLVGLLHLGKNTDLTSMDRNDWIVSFSLPVFGFGAAIAYCARYRRGWALVGLLWWTVIAASLVMVTQNITHALVPEGKEAREEFRLNR